MKKLLMSVLLFLALALPAKALITVNLGGITPNQGRAGDSVQLTGINLTITLLVPPKVYFGTQPAVCDGLNGLINLSGLFGKNITCTVPAGTPGTTIPVRMVSGLNVDIDISNSSNFTYLPNPPTVSALTPNTGPAGTSVTITGTNLIGASVSFGGASATCAAGTATQITCTAPAHANGTATVVVTTTGGTDSPKTFTYIPPAPVVSSVSPNTGPVGTPVIISGTNLANATVTFGGASAVCSGTDTQLNCSAPTHTNGLATVSVSTPGGTDSTKTFNYTTPAPVITGISPATGTEGTAVTITGTNLSGAAVEFDGTPASCPISSDTQITCNAPSHSADGLVSVTVTTATGSDDIDFTYNNVLSVPNPTITDILPAFGPSGTSVIITGTNLDGAAITFGSDTATCSGGGTQLTCAAPARSTDGSVTVTVTTGAATPATGLFEYRTPLPVVSNMAPTTGTEGTLVTFTGTYLSNATVTFGGASAVCSGTDTQLQCTAPARPNGLQTVVITTTPGGVNNTQSFTYVNPAVLPTISGISPTKGAQNTQVTITGTGLNGATVTFGGITATGCTTSDTQIICPAPAHPDGAVDVVVDVSGNQASTSFTYDTSVPVTPPAITNITPNEGGEGTIVIITGTDLANSTVTFADAIATCSATATEITCTVPAHANGSVNVTVHTPGGDALTSFLYNAILPTVAAQTDPTQDAEVRAIASAQLTSAKRMIKTQMANFNDRLGQIRNVSGNRDNFKLSLGIKEAQTPELYAYNTCTHQREPCLPFSTGTKSVEVSDVAKTLRPYSAEETDKAYAVWTGGAVHLGSEKYAGDIDYTTVGISAGIDKVWSDSLIAGFGIGYGHDKADATTLSTLTTDAYSAVLYATYAFTRQLYLEGMLGYSRLSMDADRFTVNGTASGTRDADQLFGSLGAGYKFNPGAWRLTPYGRMEAAWTGLKPYTEQGAGNLNLKYNDSDIKMFALSAGTEAGYEVKQTWGIWIPKASVEYLHNFEGNSNMNLGYADTNSTPYVFSGTAYSKDNMTLGAGVDVALKTNWTFYTGYKFTKGDNSIDNRIAVQAGYQF